MIAAGALPVPEDLARRMPADGYARLLGYPDGRIAGGRAAALAEITRERFARRSAPWAYARASGLARIGAERVTLAGGPTLTSRRLCARLRRIAAERVIVAAVSAGAGVDADSARLWREHRPDEAYFLDRFGAALAVHLAAWAGESLKAAAAAAGLGLGPGYSPGYDGWDLEDQTRVAGLLADPAAGGGAPLPGPLEVLSSGMIEPKSSLLAVFGLTRDRRAAERQWRTHACSWCSLAGCALRGRLSA